MRLGVPWFGGRKKGSDRIGIAIGPDGLKVAHAGADGVIRFCHNEQEPGDPSYIIGRLVQEHGWQDFSCTIVLHPLYYQLLLAETPKVQGDEMSSAVRWKVKDLLDYPIEQAAIEHFALPDDAYRGQKHMLYAAAIRKAMLSDLIEPIQDCGLDVDCIEVAELAIHNLFCASGAGSEGSAVIHLYQGEGLINLVEQGSIYLCRRLDVGMDRFAGGSDPAFLESLLLEIQRSLDFYESQLGKGIITHLYYSPAIANTEVIGEYLSGQLGLTVEPLVIDTHLAETVDVSAAISSAVAIGGALGPKAQSTQKEASVAAH